MLPRVRSKVRVRGRCALCGWAATTSEYWGNFNLIYRPASFDKNGKALAPAWEAACPAESHNFGGQKCRKTMTFRPNAIGDLAETIPRWRVKHWCNMAVYAANKSQHIKFHPSADDLPDERIIIQAKLPADW